VGLENQVSKTKRRAALTIPFIALAAGIGLIWTLSQPEHSVTPDAVETDAPGNAEPAELGAQAAEPAAASAAAASTLASSASTDAPARLKAVALGHVLKRGQQLKPYVALALLETQLTTEELCPELAKEAGGSEESGDNQKAPGTSSKSERDEKGCVLPIGNEPNAATAQANMPIERPPTFLGRQKLNFMPYVGGLGAAIASVPVIEGLSTNKHNRQPISPQ